MMQDNLQNAMVTVEAMKSTTKELKKQYGRGRGAGGQGGKGPGRVGGYDGCW